MSCFCCSLLCFNHTKRTTECSIKQVIWNNHTDRELKDLFIQKNKFCHRLLTIFRKVMRVWYNIRMRKRWLKFNFWVNYSLKDMKLFSQTIYLPLRGVFPNETEVGIWLNCNRQVIILLVNIILPHSCGICYVRKMKVILEAGKVTTSDERSWKLL